MNNKEVNRHSAFADPEYWMTHDDELDVLLDDEPKQPTHFRCPKCHWVYPISELSYIPEIHDKSRYNVGTTWLGSAAITRTTERTVIKHPVCKNCYEEEKESEKNSLIKIIVVIVIIAIIACFINHLT